MDDFMMNNDVLELYVGGGGDVAIPEGVTRIDSYAFDDCMSLTGVTVPRSVTHIGCAAFRGCRSLTSIIIPEGVTSIGDFAFDGCTSLTSIIIPDSVTSIGARAFERTPWLEQQSGFMIVENGVLCSYIGVEKSVTIPSGVTSIGKHAFWACKSLTDVSIPNSVTSIGNGAFMDCTSLASITIPNSVTSIDERAFAFCEGLTSVVIPASVTSIGKGAFSNCCSIQKMVNLSRVQILNDEIFNVYAIKSWVKLPALRDGYMPNEDISRMTSNYKKLAVFCYLGSEAGYSENLRDKYETYLHRQNTKLLTELAGIGDATKAAALLSRGYAKPATLEKALAAASGHAEMTALLLDYQNKHFDLAKEQEKKEAKAIRDLMRGAPTVSELKKLWSMKKQADGTIHITAYKGFEEDIIIPAALGNADVTGIDGCAFSPLCGPCVNAEHRADGIKTVTVPDSVTSIDRLAFAFCAGLTLRASAGSYAERFAKENCISFKAI